MHTSTGQFRPPQKPKRPWIAIGLVFALLVVIVNLVGYILYRDKRPKLPVDPPVEVAAASTPATGDDVSVEELAKEQRGKGVVALRSGDYERAIASFDAALRLDPNIDDVKTLREVAERLRKSVPDDEPVPEAPPPPPPPVARASRPSRRSEPRRTRPRPEPPPPVVVAARDAPDPEPEPEPEPEPARIEPPPPPPPPPPATSRALEADERLDLVALVDRNAVTEAAPRTEVTPSRVEVAPTPSAQKVAPTASGASPRLVVFWPGRATSSLTQALRPQLSGVDLTVSSNTTALRGALAQGADGVMASPSVLRSLGLSPSLTGSGGNGGVYVVASLKDALTNDQLRGVTVGIVDELGRKGMPSLVSKLLGGTAPKLRRVTKVEDLLPLLQFQIAGAVIVRQSDLAMLQSRTEQKLYTRVLTNHREPLAVGFVAGGRRAPVESAVRSLDGRAKSSLGVESWR